MKKFMGFIFKLTIGVFLWLMYEAYCDGSGIQIRERWNKLRSWAGERFTFTK